MRRRNIYGSLCVKRDNDEGGKKVLMSGCDPWSFSNGQMEQEGLEEFINKHSIEDRRGTC